MCEDNNVFINMLFSAAFSAGDMANKFERKRQREASARALNGVADAEEQGRDSERQAQEASGSRGSTYACAESR